MDGVLTEEKLRGPPFAPPWPHVVILGAGASKAAFPAGDKSGKLIPLMNEIPGVLGKSWRDILNDARPPIDGFEAQFSWIRRHGAYSGRLVEIEKLIQEYFESLSLPDCPTIYDYIVLGLRPKDLVATFNWDPFLILAEKRNRGVAGLPEIRFLHGCVQYATCAEHDVLGLPSELCPACRQLLIRSRLLLPDDKKDYTKDPIIHRDWTFASKKLVKAFHLTIFGYSGPQTDFNARRLMLEGWKQTPLRDVTHVEIIDIEDEDVLRTRWREFIPFSHDMMTADFWQSTIARWPRRTGEYKLSASLYGIPAHYLGPYRTNSLRELQEWHAAIAEAEKQAEKCNAAKA